MKIKLNKNVFLMFFFCFVVVFLIGNLIKIWKLNKEFYNLKIKKKLYLNNFYELKKKFDFFEDENKNLKKKLEEKKNNIKKIINEQEIIENEILIITNSIKEKKEKIN